MGRVNLTLIWVTTVTLNLDPDKYTHLLAIGITLRRGQLTHITRVTHCGLWKTW